MRASQECSISTKLTPAPSVLESLLNKFPTLHHVSVRLHSFRKSLAAVDGKQTSARTLINNQVPSSLVTNPNEFFTCRTFCSIKLFKLFVVGILSIAIVTCRYATNYCQAPAGRVPVTGANGVVIIPFSGNSHNNVYCNKVSTVSKCGPLNTD